MNQKMERFLGVSLALTFVLSFISAAIVFKGYAQGPQRISVDPAEIILPLETTSVGDTFTVNITAADWVDPGLWGYQFKLRYDNTMLEATAAVIPDGHLFEPETSPGIFIVDPGTIGEDGEGAFVSFGLSALAPEPGKTGGGYIATITFQITTVPDAGYIASTLDLDDVILVNTSAVEIPPTNYVVEDGYFQIGEKPPLPFLKVDPEISSAVEVGEQFAVMVTMNDLSSALELVGVEFKLRYETDYLRATSVLEGPFMGQCADFGTTFMPVIIRDYVHVGILIHPDTSTGDWYEEGWSCIPSGAGPLATITFEAIAMPETLTVTDLTIYDIILLDSNLQEIEYDPPEQGIFQAPIRREDLNADGKIDITDISIFGLAFGSYPGHDRWNADVDIVQDNRVNILDGVQIAKAYGIYAPAVTLKVEPPSTSVAVGSEFTVSITINDLDKPLYLIALQFQVFYDPFKLEVVSVTEGDFMSSFDGTWFTYEVIRDYVLVGLMKLPDETGQWGAPFPEGSGTLVTITFRCTAAGTSDLTIGSELLLDLGLDAIKNRPSVGGTVVQG